jgi:hypothetical protein
LTSICLIISTNFLKRNSITWIGILMKILMYNLYQMQFSESLRLAQEIWNMMFEWTTITSGNTTKTMGLQKCLLKITKTISALQFWE